MCDTKRKYELTEETCRHNGALLHRIKALVTIPGVVEAGDLGGWVESEENLSQNNDCWVYDDAKVFDNAKVCYSAKVYGNAVVCGRAMVYDNARVYGNAEVCDTAGVGGHAMVYDNAMVCRRAEAINNAKVFGSAKIFGNAVVCDNAMVYDNAEVYGSANVCGNAEVCQHAKVCGCTRVFDGHIDSSYDCITVGPVGSRYGFTTFNLSTGTVCAGCFKGALDEFEVAVRQTHGDNEHGRAYNKLIAYFKTLINK